MKNLILVATLVLFGAGCKSNSKKVEVPATTPVEAAKDAKSTTKGKAKAAAKEVKEAIMGSTVTCAHGSDSRTLEVKDRGDGCELIYTKNNEPNAVATAGSGKKHCEEVSAKIQSKLTDAGFACK
jgi:hypothetical protein